jgi:hypothetical protein
VPTLDGTALSITLTGTLNKTIPTDLDLQTATAPLAVSTALALANGVGAGQADLLWADTRTILASANDDLDLAGVLVDAIGRTLTFLRVKLVYLKASATNVNNAVIGAGTNPFINMLNAAGTLTVRPGGVFVAAATDAVGYAVTGGTGDILRVANSGAGSSVIYDIVIIGASA